MEMNAAKAQSEVCDLERQLQGLTLEVLNKREYYADLHSETIKTESLLKQQRSLNDRLIAEIEQTKKSISSLASDRRQKLEEIK